MAAVVGQVYVVVGKGLGEGLIQKNEESKTDGRNKLKKIRVYGFLRGEWWWEEIADYGANEGAFRGSEKEG